MTTGSTDYGVVQGQANETQSTDVLELASRLRCMAALNRTGQQIMSIDESIVYSAGFHYVDGFGGYCMPSNKYGNMNRPALKCISGANSNGFAGVSFNGLPFNGQQIGIAVFGIVATFLGTLVLSFQYQVGSYLYQCGYKISMATGALSVLNASLAYDSIGNYPIPNGWGQCMGLKITFDLSTTKYGALFYGSETVTDLTGHNFYSVSQSGADATLIQATIQNTSATSQVFYLSDVITTINEVL